MPSTGRPARLRPALLWGAGAVAAATLVHLWDPNQPGSYGFCPLRVVTGWFCPFCGGLRAVHALTHGDWALAWGLNPAVAVGLPVAALVWLGWVVASWRRREALPQSGGTWRILLPWLALAVIVLYGVLRNLPALQPHLAALT